MRLDAFLKLETQNLDGESTDTLHEKEIEILSFEQTTDRFLDTKDKSNWLYDLSVVTILKPLDATSPKLFDAVTVGKRYKKATISACRASGTSKDDEKNWKKIDFFLIELTDVYISRVQLLGDARVRSIGGDRVHRYYPEDLTAVGPVEEVELNFRTITWTYKGEDGKQNITSSTVTKTE